MIDWHILFQCHHYQWVRAPIYEATELGDLIRCRKLRGVEFRALSLKLYPALLLLH